MNLEEYPFLKKILSSLIFGLILLALATIIYGGGPSSVRTVRGIIALYTRQAAPDMTSFAIYAPFGRVLSAYLVTCLTVFIFVNLPDRWFKKRKGKKLSIPFYFVVSFFGVFIFTSYLLAIVKIETGFSVLGLYSNIIHFYVNLGFSFVSAAYLTYLNQYKARKIKTT